MSETARPTGRHPVNIGHLVMGLAFVGLVGVWGLIQADVVDHSDIRWLLPVPWVIAGIAGLLATTLTSRDRWGTQQTGWVQPGAPTTTMTGRDGRRTHQSGWVQPDETTPVGDSGTDSTADTTTEIDTDTPEEPR